MSSGLIISRLTNMSLMLGTCPNGHRHIFGFYHQIDRSEQVIDMNAMRLTIKQPCSECGCEVTSSYGIEWDSKAFIDGAGI